MHIELLSHAAEGPPRPVDVLLVHGISVGAWVWRPHFMPYLAQAGYRVHAVGLRGHGGSDGRDRLAATGLRDYVADVTDAAAHIGRPVVAVGHSLGGAVVQSAIAAGTPIAGAVLMASVPPQGLLPASLAMLLFRPRLWREVAVLATQGVAHADPDVLRDGLFADRITPAAFAAFAGHTQDESPLVGWELQVGRPFAPLPWLAPPTLVLAGAQDRFLTLADAWATAACTDSGRLSWTR
jgi:pimeloyl-ACP methyl ester carboxylesterase